MKKLLGILLVLALVLSFSLVATTPVAAQTTWYVDGTDGSDDPTKGTGPGSEAFATIQYAIDHSGTLDGHTIEVAAGTYAGATVDKGVTIEAKTGDVVTINDGPIKLAGILRVGFWFEGYTGNGATIRGLHFEGVPSGWEDDGKLDFPIFSRGAHNVVIEKNVISTALQAITNWHGDGWQIKDNEITDLWTLNGGGIGILVGANNGATFAGNVITNNKISGTLSVWESDSGGYDGTGIVLYADFRGARLGGIVTGNLLEGNEISMVSDTTAVVDFSGIELVDTRADDANPSAVLNNQVVFNSVHNNSRHGIYVSAGTSGNEINFNSIFGNQVSGVWYDGTGTLDATLNWWGDASGPSGQGQGTGDAVSTNIGFMPWLMEEDGTETTETNTDSGAGASASTTNVEATATGGDATTTVTVGEYVGNPTGASPGFRSGAVYVDVHVGGTPPDELVVEIACPGSCSGVELQWWDGDGWESVDAPTSVVNGKIQVVLSATSSPTIAELTGTPFGLGSLSTVGWEGSSVNKVAVVAPWIALMAAMMAGATLLAIRRRGARI